MMISQRFRAIMDRVPKGAVLADIACDHATVPITLLNDQKIPSAIAVDIHQQPLQRGQRAAEAVGVADKIVFRLGDGLSVLAPGEVDVIVIAGIGGVLIEQILQDSPAVVAEADRLILVPHRSPSVLRDWANRLGYFISDEQVIFEDQYYYELIIIEPKKQGHLQDWELTFGSVLARRHDAVTDAYYAYRERKDQILMAKWRSALSERPDLSVRIDHLNDLWKKLKEVRA